MELISEERKRRQLDYKHFRLHCANFLCLNFFLGNKHESLFQPSIKEKDFLKCPFVGLSPLSSSIWFLRLLFLPPFFDTALVPPVSVLA